MPESKHTPPPWERKDHHWMGEHLHEIFGGGRHIASVHTTFGVWDTNEANANVISAAPELLEALERVVAGFDAMYDKIEQSGLYDGRPAEIDGGPINQARAAIAKARGRITMPKVDHTSPPWRVEQYRGSGRGPYVDIVADDPCRAAATARGIAPCLAV